MISIVIPYYSKMVNAEFFLKRVIDSIMMQTYKDYEIVITEEGSATENTNAGIQKAKGDLIKILHQDDYFAHPNALQDIVENFKGTWLITGTEGNEFPYYTADIRTGNNKLGSPSALTIINDKPLLFREDLKWLFDCEYYERLYERYGEPEILDGVNVIIGLHDDQATRLLTDDEKQAEVNLMKNDI
jgi:glycosyltransferase involved in cell wall biosynthesis